MYFWNQVYIYALIRTAVVLFLLDAFWYTQFSQSPWDQGSYYAPMPGFLGRPITQSLYWLL